MRRQGGRQAPPRTDVNETIEASTVRLIDPEGEMLGIMSIDEARQIATEYGLDLVAISPNADPVVCKILDYGKYRYEQSRRAKEAKASARRSRVDLKEIKIRVNTDTNDLAIKARKATEFLADGHKVKVNVAMRGRELAHPEHAHKAIGRFLDQLDDFRIEKEPSLTGRNMTVILVR